MARYIVTVDGKGIRPASIQKQVEAARKAFPQGWSVSFKKEEQPSSRADRFNAAMSSVEDAKSEMEGLRDELQDWFDNMPENFQQGDKGQQLEEAIQNLETIIDGLDIAAGESVDFPGMY